jgi:hypothetical protein
VGRHRLAEAALGREPGSLASETVLVPATTPAAVSVAEAAPAVMPLAAPTPAAALSLEAEPTVTMPDAGRGATQEPTQTVAVGRSSVAPWLRIVPTPPQPDQLADTLPHPVVALFPLDRMAPTTPVAASAESADTAEEQVFAALDAERQRETTADLAGGAGVRPYRPRHTA